MVPDLARINVRGHLVKLVHIVDDTALDVQVVFDLLVVDHCADSMAMYYRKSREKTSHRIDLDVAVQVGMAELLALALGLAHADDVVVDIVHKATQDAAQSNVVGVGGDARAVAAVVNLNPVGAVVTIHVEPQQVHVVGVFGVIVPVKPLTEVDPVDPDTSTDNRRQLAVVDREAIVFHREDTLAGLYKKSRDFVLNNLLWFRGLRFRK